MIKNLNLQTEYCSKFPNIINSAHLSSYVRLEKKHWKKVRKNEREFWNIYLNM